MMSIEIFRLYIIYICRPSVYHSVYTYLLFQRYAIFLPLGACVHDVGNTGANTLTWRKTASSVTSRDSEKRRKMQTDIRNFKRRAAETQTERGKATEKIYVVSGRQSEIF